MKKIKSEKNDKTLVRLVKILSRLNDGEELSAKELSIDFGVHIRTIQKDFSERLQNSEFPFPIEYNHTTYKWKMQKGKKLYDTLSIKEQIIISTINKFSENIGGEFFKVSKGLMTKLKNDKFTSIYAKLDIEDISEVLENINILDNAIENQKEIKFKYRQGEFEGKPFKVLNFEGFWYLLFQDIKDDIIKKFYLKDIDEIIVLNRKFKIDTKIENLIENSVNIWFNERVEPFEVKLLLTKEVAKYFLRRPISKTQKVLDKFEDGSISISLEITEEMEITPTVKKFIPYIKVISPIKIKESIEEEIREYIK